MNSKKHMQNFSTEYLQDELDTMIRIQPAKLPRKEQRDFFENAGLVEAELHRRKALYPVYRFASYPKEDNG